MAGASNHVENVLFAEGKGLVPLYAAVSSDDEWGASTPLRREGVAQPQLHASTGRARAEPSLARRISALGSKHDGLWLLRVSQRLKASTKRSNAGRLELEPLVQRGANVDVMTATWKDPQGRSL
jgi:hypothetical protein